VYDITVLIRKHTVAYTVIDLKQHWTEYRRLVYAMQYFLMFLNAKTKRTS